LTETHRFQTDVNNPDTDLDSLPDNWEIEYRLNPLVDDSLEDLIKMELIIWRSIHELIILENGIIGLDFMQDI